MAIASPGGLVDYHLASQTGTMSINALQPVTLMAWVNVDWNYPATLSILGTYNTATSGGTAIQIGIRTGVNTGNVLIWTWGGTILVSSNGVIVPNSNDWCHVAYTFDGTTHKLYINGQFANSATTAQQAGIITAVYVNGYPGGGTNETGPFAVDDISYYDRELSANEVLSAFTTGGDKDGIVYGRTANYLCNEGVIGATANNVTDMSGGLNTLTPIGTATGSNFTYTVSPVNRDTRPPL